MYRLGLRYPESSKTSGFNSHNVLFDLVVVFALLFFLVCYWIAALWLTNFALIVLFFVCLYFQTKEKNFGCVFFYFTFFLFLLDTIFFGLFDKTLKYNFYNEDAEYHALLSLAIAIVGVYAGSLIVSRYKLVIGRKKFDQKTNNIIDGNTLLVSDKMRKFLKVSFIFCAMFSVVESIVKAIFVQANSYLAYYTDYSTPLPYFMIWISSISPILFYLYLGTLPRRKDVMLPIGIYLSIGIIALFYGQRNVFVIRALIIFCYFLLRNRNSKDDTWISKKEMYFLIALIPAGILFMGIWDSFRIGEQYEKRGVFESLLKILLQQGNDISIIDFEYRFRDLLPNKPFAIGGIITLLHNNVFGKIIGLQQIPAQQNTVEIALNGYSFQAALMYHENRNGFLMGYGIGSCYIAELFYSYGYVGVFLGSVFYGWLLKRLSQFQIKNFITNGLVLLVFQNVLMAPRAPFDTCISGTFQVANLFVIFICWYLSSRVWSVKSNE